jgi:uncharacterized protein
MKILIAGGTGQVGTLLSRAFHRDGHEVVVLSRHPMPRPWRVVPWDGVSFDRAWASEIDGCDVVINLVGRSVNCRDTPANRREILESRVRSTRVVGGAIARASHPPGVWLQAGTATIYAHRFDAANDDVTGVIGGAEPDAPKAWAFSIDVARAWEDACVQSLTPGTRKVILRSAMTMSPDAGGVFDTLLGLVRCGLGGQAGDGRQFVSWIHDVDFVRAVRWLIEHKQIDGPVNLASPHPLPNGTFMRQLREAWGIRAGLPAARWRLELGAIFMRTETELVLKSRRVVPRRLLDDGFVFTHAHWADAAVDLCRRWKQARQTIRARDSAAPYQSRYPEEPRSGRAR